MSNYIFASIRTDEDNLMGSAGFGEYDAKDSIKAYGQAVESAIIEAFPDAEVDVTTGAARLYVDSDVATADDIRNIIERVWQGWEWLRK